MPISDAQKTVLLTYFNNGMVGVGKKYAAQINAAVAETGLTERQVKVRNRCILKCLKVRVRFTCKDDTQICFSKFCTHRKHQLTCYSKGYRVVFG